MFTLDMLNYNKYYLLNIISQGPKTFYVVLFTDHFTENSEKSYYHKKKRGYKERKNE